jgi:hypothetical protein
LSKSLDKQQRFSKIILDDLNELETQGISKADDIGKKLGLLINMGGPSKSQQVSEENN